MTTEELLKTAKIGDIVKIRWIGPMFDPEMIIKPGDPNQSLTHILSCGFLAKKSDTQISLGIDGMYENGSQVASYRGIVTVPVSNILSGDITGRISAPPPKA